MPEPDEEVEQHLTINNEGRVWFSGYNFGRGGERYEKARSKNFKLDKLAVDKLFGAMQLTSAVNTQKFLQRILVIGLWN